MDDATDARIRAYERWICEELAAMAKLGKVALREGNTVFDDAMHQVTGRLQSAANQD